MMATIVIDRKTLTINHLYGQRGFRKFIKKEGKELREYIKKCVKAQFEGLIFEDKLSVTIRICEDWLTKKGEVKRKDLDNRCKFLLDSIFSALNIDDKYVYELKMCKVQSDKEKAIVIIEAIQ
jgi:Holliday junction resolvase RusA-like endonuclease|tara:strand:+ start:38775 stop:39143 length:369 start_codon:yes stop_codon:yes gene_type:complete